MTYVVSSKSNLFKIRIYINDILHLYIPRERLRGIQSWSCYGMNFHIEIILDGLAPLHLEYDKEELWRDVLNALDKEI